MKNNYPLAVDYQIVDLRKQLHGLAQQLGLCKDQFIGIYYLGNIIYLNGNSSDKSYGNLAMECPCCKGRILLSRFTPQDIWLFKNKGLSYAEIGRILNLSRERVRQLCKKYEAQLLADDQSGNPVDIDKLVNQAQNREKSLRVAHRDITIKEARERLENAYDDLNMVEEEVTEAKELYLKVKGSTKNSHNTYKKVKKRLTDKRTIKKRLIAKMKELNITIDQPGEQK